MPSIVLLPEQRRFAGQPISKAIAQRLGRADRLPEGKSGEQAQLERYFDVQPGGWPMAAIQRQYDVGDAGDSVWLRADPVHVRPDMTGVRLMAWGNLAITDDHSRQFLTALSPVFHDAGLEMSATAPDRWFLRLPGGDSLAEFAPPVQVLGADLFEHLPSGGAGRRWRRLLSESQVVLHNHPVNSERIARGQPTVNSVWFWGGGALPEEIVAEVCSIDSQDPALRALFARSNVPESESSLCDLRHSRDWLSVEKTIAGTESVTLDFADGTLWSLHPRQRWRFWRRPLCLWQA